MSPMSLNAVFDSDSSQFYFECQLSFNFKSSLFTKTEIFQPAIQLKRVDSISGISCEDSCELQFSGTHDDVGELCLNLLINKSAITFKNIKLGHLKPITNSVECFSFHLDSQQLHGLCLDSQTCKYSAVHAHFCKHSIFIYSYFTLSTSIENYPKPSERDEAICAVLHRPNVDLLNDWVFCGHNHSHSSEPKDVKHEAPFHIPEHLFKPIVLDQLEQVIYLLADSPKILLESYENKNNSIYLQFFKSNIFTLTSSCDHEWGIDNGTDMTFLNEESRLLKDLTQFLQKCLVHHQIFGDNCITAEEIEDSCESSSEGDIKPNHAYQQMYYSQDNTLLTKYRMSFEVEWFRIEEKLFHSLARLLIDSSEHLARMKPNFNSAFSDIISNGTDLDLHISAIESFKFTKVNS